MSETIAEMVVSTTPESLCMIAKSKLLIKIEQFPAFVQSRTIESPKIKLVGCNTFWSVVIAPSGSIRFERNLNSNLWYTKVQLKVEGFSDGIKSKLKFELAVAANHGQPKIFNGQAFNNDGKCLIEFPKNHLDKGITANGTCFVEILFQLYLSQEFSVRARFYDPVALQLSAVANFSKIFADPTFSDFTFNVKGKKFTVHKNILAAASPVMHKLFTSNFAESNRKYCNINHIQPKVFEIFLRFIYTGEVPTNIKDVSMDLYEAAHYYGIDELKRICKQEIHGNLSKENAPDIYEWSCSYDDLEDLKKDSWEVLKRDILKIHFPLAREPLSFSEINEIIKQNEEEERFWAKFVK